MIIGGPALTKYNDRTLRNLTTAPASASSSPGALVHIKTVTGDGSGTNVTFVNGTSDVVLDSTYPIYKFVFTNVHPATDSVYLDVNFRDGSTAYDATKTTTGFTARHDEADTATSLEYTSSDDLAQSTAAQHITGLIGNGNDESTSGELWLFNPSSTTYVKHFMARSNVYDRNNRSVDFFAAGYCNVTAAIDGVQFIMSSGNMDAGTIKLYGIKDA